MALDCRNPARLARPGRHCLWAFVALSCLAAACAPTAKQPDFDPYTCLETIPRRVPGLVILSGPRTPRSIIRDMVPAVCHAKALFRQIQARGEAASGGSAVFRVVVEYTGEVRKVEVIEAAISPGAYLARVADFIRSTDFIFWGADDQDTVFVYPLTLAP